VLVCEPCSASILLLVCIDLFTCMLVLSFSNVALEIIGAMPYPAKHGYKSNARQCCPKLAYLILIQCFFQAKILYKPVPFTEDERENIKLTIQSNVYGYLGILLEGRDRFEEENLAAMKNERSTDETEAIGMLSLSILFIFSTLVFFFVLGIVFEE